MTISMLAGAYLFFGGVGAGTFFWSAGLDCGRLFGWLRALPAWDMRWIRGVSSRGYVAASALMACGIMCLVFDLGRPSQALLVFLYPTVSYLTLGAYLLATLGAISLAVILADQFGARGRDAVVFRVIICVGAGIAVGVMLYTGLLLSQLAPVALWTSAWLPVLFVASSLAGGAGCVVLCMRPFDEDLRAHQVFTRAGGHVDAALLVIEVAACACLVADAAVTPLGRQSVRLLVSGAASALFWGGFVLCGVLAPAVGDVLVFRGQMRGGAVGGVALASLVGCLCLRLALVLAGMHEEVGAFW